MLTPIYGFTQANTDTTPPLVNLDLPSGVISVILSYQGLETILQVAKILQAMPAIQGAINDQIPCYSQQYPLTNRGYLAYLHIYIEAQSIPPSLPNLRHLNFTSSHNTDTILQEVIVTCPNLQTFHMDAPRAVARPHSELQGDSLIPAVSTLAPLTTLNSLQHLDLHHRVISSDDLRDLTSCPALTSLSLVECFPPAISPLNLNFFSKLKRLSLQATDVGLRGPGCPELPNLEVLQIDQLEFLNFGMFNWGCLSKLPNLHTLILRGAFIDAHPLGCLADLPQIQCVCFDACAYIDGLQHLDRLKNLHHLQFIGCTGLNQKHLRQLKSPPLKSIDFISCEGMQSYEPNNYPNLKETQVNFGRRGSISWMKKASLKDTTPH